jgi:hypothetical protein
MKPYGMTRQDAGDDDAGGCKDNGRATRVYAVPGLSGDARAYRALRGGRKARIRRHAKRAARRDNRAACTEE